MTLLRYPQLRLESTCNSLRINTNNDTMTKMQYQNLGSSGLRVSKVILGTMSYGSSRWQDWVRLENTSQTPISRAI